MHPVLLKIGNFYLYTHGVLAVLGIIAASIVLYYLAKREKLSLNFLFDNIVYTILFGIIGARLAYFILYNAQFNNPIELFFLWEGGMVSYGGFIAGGVAMAFLLRSQKQKILRWFDLLAVAFLIGQFFGRIGNIFAGEYSGLPTTSSLNMHGLVPVTLYEGIYCLILFAALLLLYLRRGKIRDGFYFFLVLMAYPAGRFVIDFWRDEKNLVSIFSLGQMVSLVFLLSGALLFSSLFIRKLKTKGV
jgi:phosphatidylglycerol:prolipoprotein diacylglycerol transferase